MRRARSEVAHRVRREPSIFSARWFRIALGVGVALVLALLVGPSLAGWFGGDLPRSLFLLVPWSTDDKPSAPGSPAPASPRSSIDSPAAPSAGSAEARGAAAASGKGADAPADGHPSGDGQRVTGEASTASPVAALAPAPRPSRASGRVPPSAEVVPARAGALAAPPAVYWVQVGAFLDHRNADRFAERLRSEGLTAATTAFEQSRVLYRVLLVGSDDGRAADDVMERVQGLGHPVETVAEGPAVAGLVPLRRAVEMSHTLRQHGISVRLKQEVSSSTYRVVRVGSFATVADAEATLATLTARGVEGVVVRER